MLKASEQRIEQSIYNIPDFIQGDTISKIT